MVQSYAWPTSFDGERERRCECECVCERVCVLCVFVYVCVCECFHGVRVCRCQRCKGVKLEMV